jgi:ribonuclease T1
VISPVSTSGLAAIVVAELPDEAIEILGLIDSDGPFKYDKDGSTFQNREGLLPGEPSGYYREYTVDTPGAYDRGARRIVGGDDGERYYSADHYSSFSEIVDW